MNLQQVIEKQKELQKIVTKDTGLENVVHMYNAATGAIVEIGEMLQEDTRWKQFVTFSKREPHYDKQKFIEEYCDVMLYLMNVAIFAGISYDDILTMLNSKQQINFKRFNIV